MKKTINFILILAIVIPTFFIPEFTIQGQTIGDIKRELNQYKQDYKENKLNQQLTEEGIVSTKVDIRNAQDEINQIEDDMIMLTEEIAELEEKIIIKEQKIKDIVRFVQISKGESAYLEYTFGAKTFADFIYRSAVADQIANYNDRLVDEFNENIEANKAKKIQIANRRKDLINKQNNLSSLLIKLNEKLTNIAGESMEIEAEIKMREEALYLYVNKYKCTDNMKNSQCTNQLPYGTAFWRPLITGRVSSNYGWRDLDRDGKKEDFHRALDMSTTDNGNVPVYSAASGIIAAVSRGNSCGNTIVYIHHNIKGEHYTTSYWHMRTAKVKVGDFVTKDTQIGIMGGWPWEDSCSTGPHVHFMVANGLYLKDYHTYTAFKARAFNPRIVLNVPSKGVTFKNRTTKY